MANVSHYFFLLCGLLLIALSIYTFAYSELISEEKKNTYTNLKLILSFITSTPLILFAIYSPFLFLKPPFRVMDSLLVFLIFITLIFTSPFVLTIASMYFKDNKYISGSVIVSTFFYVLLESIPQSGRTKYKI
jgi:cyanate permease